MNKNSKVKSAFVAMCAVLVTVSCAMEYTLNKAPQSLEDWKNGAFYEGGVAPTEVNAFDAVVTLPADMTAKVDDNSVSFVGSFCQIKPMDVKTSILLVDISSDASFRCSVYYAAPSTSADTATRGRIVKTGLGTLHLEGATASSYFTDFDIQSGAVDFGGMPISQISLGRINIGSDGMLILLANGSSLCRNYMINLAGSGIVTNGVGTAANCRLMPGYGEGSPVEFSGRILDKVTLYTHGYEHFSGEESNFSGGVYVNANSGKTDQGILGIKKFGLKGGVSSIGSSPTVYLAEYGGRILYLGEGENTDKEIAVYETHIENKSGTLRPGVIDGGAHGDLTIKGQLLLRNTSLTQRLVLTGSNTVACAYDGTMNKNNNTYVYVTKKGSGIWRIGGESNDGIDGVSVEEGTLQFMKLADVGKKSSFGDGSRFSVDKYVTTGEEMEIVPYLFKLGSAMKGVIEFVGTNDSYSSTTPLVLAGDGEIANSGSTNLLFHGGISCLVAAPATLTLSGDSACEAVVSSVSNGNGTVSIVKEGSGTWILDGTNNTFTGGIDVKSGKLILRGLGGFSWYRWTIRGNRQSTGSTFNRISEFAFFDKDNLRTGLNMVMAGSGIVDANYNPDVYRERVYHGSVALGQQQSYIYNGYSYANMFDGVCDTFGYIDLKIGGWTTTKVPDPENSSTWVTFVMHLPEGAAVPASYDWGCWGVGENGKPKNWLLEGSHDGVIWYTVDDVTDGPGTTNKRYSFQWAFNKSGSADASGSAMGTAEDPHLGGRRFTVLEAASPVIYSQAVSVATGSVLEGVEDIVLSSLKVEPMSGGMIRNVSFATSGSIDIASKFDGSEVVIPLTFDNVTGLENVANWSVSVEGAPNAKYKVSVKGDRICVTKPAFVIVIK